MKVYDLSEFGNTTLTMINIIVTITINSFDSAELSIQDALYEEEDNISNLSQLSSTQFTGSFDFDGVTIPSSQESGQVDTTTPNEDSVTSGSSIWRMRNTSWRSWIWQHGVSVSVGGKKYWKCKLYRNNPKRYIEGSMKHPIKYLRSHRMTAYGPLDPTASASII